MVAGREGELRNLRKGNDEIEQRLRVKNEDKGHTAAITLLICC